MEKSEAKTSVKAIYLQSAAMAGFEVGPNSPERLVKLVDQGFLKVEPGHKAKAVANLLRLIAMTLELAEKNHEKQLQESSVDAGREKVCPVYPFGQKAATPHRMAAKKR